MRTVFKYPIAITDSQAVHVHGGEMITADDVKLVGLDPQGRPCLWIEVGAGHDLEPVTILVRGTGHEIPLEAEHLGSFLIGAFVWHVYLKT